MTDKGRIVSSRRLYEGKVLALDLDEVVEPGDVRATREVVRHRGSVACLAVHGDGRVVLISQYRHAVADFVYEIPAGRLDPGETPETGAARELEEEVGLRPSRIEKLIEFHSTPGFCDEVIHLYRASGLRAVPPRPEADERIEIHTPSIAEARAMVARGQVRDAKTLVALLLESERQLAEATR